MSHELPGDHADHVDALQAYARDRLGMEVQAIAHLGRPVRIERAPDVWRVMTEAGTFWLVERDGVVELFPATAGGFWRRDSLACRSPRHAARQFLDRHP